jgi:hypothetical protein
MCANHCDWIGCQRQDPPPNCSPPPTAEVLGRWILFLGTIDVPAVALASRWMLGRDESRSVAASILKAKMQSGDIVLPLDVFQRLLAGGA